MELQKNTWHSKLYSFAYKLDYKLEETTEDDSWMTRRRVYHLPNNFCVYFWRVMFAIVLLPFYLGSSLFMKLVGEPLETVGIGGKILIQTACIVLVLALHCLGLFFYGMVLGLTPDDSFPMWVLLCAAPTSVVLVVLGFLALAITHWICQFIKGSFTGRREDLEGYSTDVKLNIFVVWFIAFKDKYCPVITWKEEDKDNV